MKKVITKEGITIDYITADEAVGRMSHSYDKPDGALDHDSYVGALAPYGLEGSAAPETVTVTVPKTSDAWAVGTVGGALLFVGAMFAFWLYTQQKGK